MEYFNHATVYLFVRLGSLQRHFTILGLKSRLGGKRFVFESTVRVNVCQLSLALFCTDQHRLYNLESRNSQIGVTMGF